MVKTRITPTEEMMKRLEQAIGLGATWDLAAKYTGISHDTLERWRKRGAREKSGVFREVLDRIHAAEGRAVVGWLAKIEMAAGEGDWRAAAWKLERRYPDQYSRQVIEQDTAMDLRVVFDPPPKRKDKDGGS
jgi:transposase